MSAFGTPSVLGISSMPQGIKTVTFSVAGTASYDTGGSVLNLNVTALGADAGFTRVDSVTLSTRDTAAEDRYHATYIRAASGAPATGVVKVRDLDTTGAGGTDGLIQVTSTTDLSTVTFFGTVVGV
jgi:hypothetical protein